MSDKARIPWADAYQLARQLEEHLWPACLNATIAGSICRVRPDVADIELLAIPMIETSGAPVGLFGETEVSERDLLHELCERLKSVGLLADRLDKNGRPAWGRKFKRMLFKGFPADLFITTRASWGFQQVIRTGPADFSHSMVTDRTKGWQRDGEHFPGFLPQWAKCEDGRVLHRESREVLPMHWESDFFALCGLEWIHPRDRDGWIEHQRRVLVASR